MDSIEYAKTPTGRKFQASGSLTVDTPSLLKRRQAVTNMATLNRRREADLNRVYRNANRASRQGDLRAGLLALDLGDRAAEQGIQLGGIRSADQRMNAAALDLEQRGATNDELMQLEADAAGVASNDPTTPSPMPQRFDPSYGPPMPNESLATAPAVANEGVVGGPSGLEATPLRPGPSPAQGGLLARRSRYSTPVSSTRELAPTPSPVATPQRLDPAYGPPVGGTRSSFDAQFPAVSGLLARLQAFNASGESLSFDPGPNAERDVASYRFDESLAPISRNERMKKRASKRAETLDREAVVPYRDAYDTTQNRLLRRLLGTDFFPVGDPLRPRR